VKKLTIGVIMNAWLMSSNEGLSSVGFGVILCGRGDPRQLPRLLSDYWISPGTAMCRMLTGFVPD
jgi:hypothetical protein